jgi:predicted ATPase
VRRLDLVIRTPDQRLRVFVSSTMDELADERRAVEHAISELRLTPVMFEEGARPNPRQDVYRAYLAQNDIFIGLYWQEYGSVAPGMEISDLEDEFELARGLPQLLYVKVPAPDREPRLAQLLARIRDEAATSYRHFRTAAELRRLVPDDLATLMSERFAAGLAQPAASRSRPYELPVNGTSLLGREDAIEEVAELLTSPSVRLVTITGPGGVGKTRLALAVGDRLRNRFHAGAVFVSLATVTKPERALVGIARAMRVDLIGTGSALEALVEQIGDGAWLLILDNLEQVIDVAGSLDELLGRCAGVAILATSRTVLRLRAEREYPILGLPVPADAGTRPVEDLAGWPAVALFLDRARAVRQDFALTAENAAAVVEICRRLEGLPLAIELAAARTRLLDPQALLRRLDTSLGVLGTGPVDLPERQRTLRATVDWSVGLLNDDERALLEAVAVFVDGWTIDAAARVADLDEDRTLELSEALARHSLIRLDVTAWGPRLRMLETVREFVAERLAARPDAAEIRRRHAEHYRWLAESADRPLREGSAEWLDRLDADARNLAAAVRWYLNHDRAPLPHLYRVLWPFGSLREHLGYARPLVDDLLTTVDSFDARGRSELLWAASVTATDIGDDVGALAARAGLAPLLDGIQDANLEALAELAMAWSAPIAGDLDEALRWASASLESLRRQDEPFWITLALFTTGTLEIALRRYEEASRHLLELRNVADRFDNGFTAAGSRVQLGKLAIAQGRTADAGPLLDEALDLSLAARSTHFVSLSLMGFASLAFTEGAAERAALVVGAADGVRRRVGMRAWPMLRRGEADLATRVRQALSADRYDRAYAAGALLSQQEAVATVGRRRVT